MSSRDPRYGWAVVAVLAVTETVSWGVLYYAFAVFQAPMQRDLGWSRPELTGAFSVALATSALAAFPVGRWLDRHSPRPLMTAGSTAGALLVLAWSRVHELWLFYLIWVGIGLAMACVLYEAAFTVIAKWFRAQRRHALTALTLVGGLASFVFSPLSNWLIDAQGWRSALVTLAIVLAVATVSLHGLFLRGAPTRVEEDVPPFADGELPTAQPERPIATGAAIGSSGFWYLTAAFVLSSFAISAVAVHLIPYLLEAGRSAGFAAAAAGLLGVMQIPGRVVFASASRALPRRYEAPVVFCRRSGSRSWPRPPMRPASSPRCPCSAWPTGWPRSSARRRSPTPTARPSTAASRYRRGVRDRRACRRPRRRRRRIRRLRRLRPAPVAARRGVGAGGACGPHREPAADAAGIRPRLERDVRDPAVPRAMQHPLRKQNLTSTLEPYGRCVVRWRMPVWWLGVGLALGNAGAAAAGLARVAARPPPVVARLIRIGLPVYCGGTRGRDVALTFDDGPGVYTARALTILRQEDARATFFLVGSSMERFPRLVRREAQLAALGDHTWTHPFLPELPASTISEEIARAKAAIERATGIPVWLFRPPYDARSEAVDREVRALGLLDVIWDVDSRDWAPGMDWSRIGRRVIGGRAPGAIVAMHENHGQTIRALRYLILPALRRLHLHPVTVPALLEHDPPTLPQLHAGFGGCVNRRHLSSGRFNVAREPDRRRALHRSAPWRPRSATW